MHFLYVPPQGAEYPVLAGQYVCVGVYQRAHEESHVGKLLEQYQVCNVIIVL